MVAEVVAAVQDPAGDAGVLVEPGPDGQHGDACAVPFGLVEQGAGDGGVALAVEGEGDAGTVAGPVRDLDGLSGEGARRGRGEGRAALPGAAGADGAASWAATAAEGAAGEAAGGEQAAASAPPATSPAPARSAERRSDVVIPPI